MPRTFLLFWGSNPESGWLLLLVAALTTAVLVLSILLWRAKRSESALPFSNKAEKPTLGEIVTKTSPSVVVVEGSTEDGRALHGSGFVASDGVVVTNYHVIRGTKSLTVRLSDENSLTVRTILSYSIESDLAALAVPRKSAAWLPIEHVQEPSVGDRVIAIGAPLGLEQTISEGIISAIRDYGGIQWIQTTVPISPGSSGGPLLNEYGNVIGVNTYGIKDGQNLNFAVSARHIIDALKSRRRISTEDLLAETRVVQQLPAETLCVPPAEKRFLEFDVEQDGSVLEGTLTVKGGHHDDIEVDLLVADENGELLTMTTFEFEGDRIKVSGRLELPLDAGHYALVFDNAFSTFSSKSLTLDLKLRFYR